MSETPLKRNQWPGVNGSAILNTIQFLRDPDALVAKHRQRYGDTFLLRLLFGDILMFTNPKEIKELFAIRGEHMTSYVNKILQPLLGTKSVFLTGGETHRNLRKAMMPFFQGRYVASLGDTVRQRTLEHMRALPVGSHFKAVDMLRGLLIEVMLDMAIGSMPAERVAKYRALVESVDDSPGAIIFFLAPLRSLFLGLGPWRAMDRKMAELTAMLDQDIQQRRASGPTGDDALSQLIGHPDFDDESIQSQLITIVFAGYETTTITTSWALYWLHQHPQCLASVHEEIDALGPDPDVQALGALKYLDAVCMETLRISPALNIVPRRMIQDCTVANYAIEEGMALAASVTEVHFDASIYPNPTRFDPERFLNKKPNAQEFLPFGGGVRKCLGATMAMYEMKVILASILGNYVLQSDSKRTPKRKLHSVALGPDDRIPMTLKSKRQVAVAEPSPVG